MESRLVIPATAAAIHGVERMRTFARIPRAPLNEGKRANSASCPYPSCAGVVNPIDKADVRA